MYVIAHLLFTSRQLSGLKMPPAWLSLHDTMPITEADGLEISVMYAVMAIGLPVMSAGFDCEFVDTSGATVTEV